MKQKKSLYALAVVTGVLILGLVGYFTFTKTKSIYYSCANGKSLNTSFIDKQMTKIRVVLNDSRELELTQSIAASGTRYTNSDESVVFWSKGTTAFLTEQNIETYTNCVERN